MGAYDKENNCNQCTYRTGTCEACHSNRVAKLRFKGFQLDTVYPAEKPAGSNICVVVGVTPANWFEAEEAAVEYAELIQRYWPAAIGKPVFVINTQE